MCYLLYKLVTAFEFEYGVVCLCHYCKCRNNVFRNYWTCENWMFLQGSLFIVLNIKFYPISTKCRPGAASYWNYSFYVSECPLVFALCKSCHQRMYAESLCEHLIISNLLCCRQVLPAIATGYRIRFAFVWSVSSNCYASSVGDYSGPKLICNNIIIIHFICVAPLKTNFATCLKKAKQVQDAQKDNRSQSGPTQTRKDWRKIKIKLKQRDQRFKCKTPVSIKNK